MAQRFEYDVLQMEPAPGGGEHFYRWRCCKHGGTCDPHELEPFLNRLGADGWHVAAHSTDARFGNVVILQRALEDGANYEPRVVTVGASGPYPAPTLSLGENHGPMLLAELRAIREQWVQPQQTVAPILTAEAIVEALAPVTDELRAAAQAIVNTPPPASPIATLDETALARLEAVANRPLPPTAAVLDPASLAALEEMLCQTLAKATAAPTQTVLDPSALQWIEELLAQSRSRDDDGDSSGGLPVAILDPAALARIEAALAIPTSVAVSASATLDKEAVATLQAIRTSAAIDAKSIARLERAIHRATARAHVAPAQAVLTPAAVEQLQAALAALPSPTVEATAILAPEAVAALRSALTEALERAPAAPIVVSTSLDADAVARLQSALEHAVGKLAPTQPVHTTLDAASLRRLEEAICRAVSGALAPTPVIVTEAAPKRAWWMSWFTWRPRLAFGR